MGSYKKYLKMSAFINFVLGYFLLSKGFIAIAFFILGLLLISYSKEEASELCHKKKFLTFILVFLIIGNLLSAIFLILAMNDLEKEKSYKIDNDGKTRRLNNEDEQISSESKKIDLLLKLGVGMVFASGVLFATTTWNSIGSIVKLIALVIMGFLFLGLSYFTEKKLNIKKTSYMYWFLSMSFFFSIILGVGYFGILGEQLSFDGDYKDIMYSITYLYLAILGIISYLKYRNRVITNAIYTGIFLAINHFLIGIGSPAELSLLLMSAINMCICLFVEKDSSLYNFSDIICYILAFSIITTDGREFALFYLLASIVSIANLIYNARESKNDLIEIASILTVYALVYSLMINLDAGLAPALAMLLTTLFTILINIDAIYSFDKSKIFNTVMYLTSYMILFLISFGSVEFQPLVISIIFSAYCVATKFNHDKTVIDKYLFPTSLFFNAVGVGYFVNSIASNIPIVIFTAILTYAYMIVYLLSKNTKGKTYLYYTIFSVILTAILNIDDLNGIVQLIAIFPLIIIFILYDLNSADKTEGTLMLMTILSNVYIALVGCNLFAERLINIVVALVLFILFIIITRKDKYYNTISNFSVLLPLLDAVNSIGSSIPIIYSYKYLLVNIIEFYTLYLLLRYFFTNKAERQAFALIGSLIIIIQVFFNTDAIVALYVGIVSFIMIFVGYYFKDYEKLFITGIIITVCNIIYQLREIWIQVPFWLYLLVGGLSIIVFVTYKEIKNMQSKNNKK